MTATRLKLTIALTAVVVAGTASAAQVSVPDEEPFAPVYARTLAVPGADWVFTYLYRDRSCVPDDFDIWGQFFDFSGAAFECPLLMEGIAVGDPDFPGPPRLSNLHNLPGVLIPVILVSMEDWSDLVADGVVTVSDLENAPSALLGWADRHHDLLQPLGGESNVAKANYQGSGTLEDGRSFRYRYVGQFLNGVDEVRSFTVTIR